MTASEAASIIKCRVLYNLKSDVKLIANDGRGLYTNGFAKWGCLKVLENGAVPIKLSKKGGRPMASALRPYGLITSAPQGTASKTKHDEMWFMNWHRPSDSATSSADSLDDWWSKGNWSGYHYE